MRRNNKILNRNSTPFFILAIIHIYMLLVMLERRKIKDTFTLLLSNMGIAYLFEYVILNLLKGYKYKPKIMKNHFMDAILGAILSQGLYVPTAATYLTLFKKNWKWKISFSLFYYCIEKLFIRLKVYKVYWWKPIYTLALLNIYFYISDGFHKALSKQKKWALSTAYYLSIEVIGVTLLYVLAVLRQIRFGFGHIHSWREHFIIAPLYSFILSYIAFKTSSNPRNINRLFMLILNLTVDFILVRTGILKLNFNEKLATIPKHLFMIVVSRFIYIKMYEKEKQPN